MLEVVSGVSVGSILMKKFNVYRAVVKSYRCNLLNELGPAARLCPFQTWRGGIAAVWSGWCWKQLVKCFCWSRWMQIRCASTPNAITSGPNSCERNTPRYCPGITTSYKTGKNFTDRLKRSCNFAGSDIGWGTADRLLIRPLPVGTKEYLENWKRNEIHRIVSISKKPTVYILIS